MMRARFRVLAVLMTGALLGACDLAPDWFGGTEAPPLPGQRLSVLALEGAIEPDPRIADLDVRLPRPYINERMHCRASGLVQCRLLMKR